MGITDIQQELVVHLRNSDILSTSVRGVTTSQDTGTFSSDSSHTLATNPTLARNVRSVIVGGTTLNFGTDYTVNYNTGVISFTSNQTGAYTIDYDQGSTDKIFGDIPRDDLSINSYPRIAVTMIGATSEAFGIGGSSTITDYFISIIAYSISVSDNDTYLQSIRQAILDSAKDFYYIRFIKPSELGPIIESPNRSGEIVQRNQDFEINFEIEQAS